MSSYIVDTNHISYLVHAAQTLHPHGFTWWSNEERRRLDFHVCTPLDVAQGLREVNELACRGRHEPHLNNRTIMAEDLLPWGISTDPIDPVQLLESIRCYVYQCCGIDEWDGCELQSFCLTLQNLAIQVLAEREGATWGAPPEPRPSGAVNIMDM